MRAINRDRSWRSDCQPNGFTALNMPGADL
jgi:hypothetical protein